MWDPITVGDACQCQVQTELVRAVHLGSTTWDTCWMHGVSVLNKFATIENELTATPASSLQKRTRQKTCSPAENHGRYRRWDPKDWSLKGVACWLGFYVAPSFRIYLYWGRRLNDDDSPLMERGNFPNRTRVKEFPQNSCWKRGLSYIQVCLVPLNRIERYQNHESSSWCHILFLISIL